jgi:hypothetical protein
MNVQRFDELVALVRPSLEALTICRQKNNVSIEEMIAVTLWQVDDVGNGVPG